MVSVITREELKQKLDRGEKPYIVEALPEETFRRGHIPGAIRVPDEPIEQWASRLLPDKQREVVSYCSGFK